MRAAVINDRCELTILRITWILAKPGRGRVEVISLDQALNEFGSKTVTIAFRELTK